jgi:GLPGLI family protein
MDEMKTPLVLFFYCFIILLYGQKSVQVSYQQTSKLNFDMKEEGLPEGIDLSQLLPESTTQHKLLIAEGKRSVYIDDRTEVEEEMNFSSDDGSMQLSFVKDNTPSILYQDIEEGVKINQQGFMGKSFVVRENPEKLRWKIGSDKISYLNYECIKASTTTKDGKEVVVWFSPQLPFPHGPSFYNQLPGLVLLVSIDNGQTEIKAIEVKTEEVNTALIEVPKEGKKVTAEEFESIMEEKMKEMEQQYGGSGNSIIIRK